MLRIAVFLSLFIAGSVSSQEATDLSMGQPVGELAVGGQYEKAIHGDWTVRCIKAPEGKKDRCTIYQLLREADGNPIAEVSMFNLPNAGAAVAGATIITPLETLLQPQLQIVVDAADAKVYPFSFCSTNGCYARVGFTALELSALERGTSATLTIFAVSDPQTPIQITLSLSGFTAAYDALFD